MSQEAPNSTENVNIPHGISFWFQRDFTGSFLELGDCLVDSVTISPEFLDFRSYRNGVNAIRKRLLSTRSASVAMTLNEPNIYNLQRALLGGTISEGQTYTILEGRHLEIDSDGGGLFIDLADAGETLFGSITVTAIYAKTDVLEATNLLTGNQTPNTDGKVYLSETDAGFTDGQTVYVKYQVATTSLYKSEIYGATNSTVEGAAKLQARNMSGGVMQIWDLASVHLAANGNLSYGLAAIQTVPILATLQERGGTFGNIYTK